MGDLAKAKRELEELYQNIPEESVNLTFEDLADVKQHLATSSSSSSSNKKNSGPILIDPISEGTPVRQPLIKLPSLDFSIGLQAYANQNNNNNHHHHHYHLHGMNSNSPPRRDLGGQYAAEDSVSFDDMSGGGGGSSMAAMNAFQERRRPGIPHSNVCTICTVYIFVFRHRCLVCGRVYCRQCLSIGMGEMTEGRKCIECLGMRFSQRYIQRAGKVAWAGCWRKYSRTVKKEELKWAEKGPRKSGENRYDQSGIISRSRSPMTPRTPSRVHATSGPPSFVLNSPHSPYSPTNRHIPL